MEKKERSEAQKRAEKKYREKIAAMGLERSEAQKRADKKYKKKIVTMTIDVKPHEAEFIDSVKKKNGMTRKEMLLYAANILDRKNK